MGFKAMSVTIGEYTLCKKLGAGASSEVWEASYKNEKYALKYMKMIGTAGAIENSLQLFHSERKALAEFKHPNIVALHGYEDKGFLVKANGEKLSVAYISIELASGGELFDYVALTGRFSDALTRHYFRPLLDALEHIHAKGFAHRDIKLENLLLTSTYQLRVADFGLSCSLTKGEPCKYVGTVDYMAPEINAKDSVGGVEGDLFALGVLLFTMVAGHKPFKKASIQDKWYRMLCLDNEKFWITAEHKKPAGIFTKEFKDLINKLLSYKPDLRPSIKEMRAHPWLRGAEMPVEKVKQEMDGRHAQLEILSNRKV
eukprot:TRINITY_DN14504_c0_g1_i4.p1 TRINITY_DN14504_c0_g1~~TRINITY_DN14504_c0_g1_i4.p1  ORF type:complete len:314 (-),score=78.77 TRINITY_DN14504_c0_g1_i4:177-1118(-)